MIKKLYSLSLFFLTTSFCSFSHQTPEYIKISNKISSSYCQELSRNKGLYLTGSGGAMVDDIKKINVHFDSFASLSVEEARKLYVEVAEGFLKRYNENEAVRPYLHNYPFKLENLELMISFTDETRKRRSEGLVALVFNARKDLLFYYGYDEKENQLYEIYEESYSQAIEMTKQGSFCSENTN